MSKLKLTTPKVKYVDNDMYYIKNRQVEAKYTQQSKAINSKTLVTKNLI